jgi:membrane protein
MDKLQKKIYELTKVFYSADAGPLSANKAAALKYARFIYFIVKQYTDGDLTLRATSLVYTTLLSIVPFIAVTFSVLKGFGVHDMAEPILERMLAPLGDQSIEIAGRIIMFVDNMKVGVLGSIGLSLLIYTVISLIAKIEESLNYIWRVRSPRSMARRFSDYMSVLLIGPILIFSAIGITAAIKSNTVVKGVLSYGMLGMILVWLGHLVPYITTCAAFTFIYGFMPSTRVKFTSALAGGVFAGVIWELSGWAFATFVVKSTNYSAVYSGLAILIVFMLWLYLSWLIFLLGAAVSFYAQYPKAAFSKASPTGREAERLGISVMFIIAEAYATGKKLPTPGYLSGRLGVPSGTVQAVLEKFIKDGLVVEAGDEVKSYLPARATEKILIKDVVKSIARFEGEDRARSRGVPEAEDVVLKIDSAVAGAFGEGTVKDLIASKQ